MNLQIIMVNQLSSSVTVRPINGTGFALYLCVCGVGKDAADIQFSPFFPRCEACFIPTTRSTLHQPHSKPTLPGSAFLRARVSVSRIARLVLLRGREHQLITAPKCIILFLIHE